MLAKKTSKILLRSVKVAPSESGLEKVRLKMKKLGITEKDVEEAIAWAKKGVK